MSFESTDRHDVTAEGIWVPAVVRFATGTQRSPLFELILLPGEKHLDGGIVFAVDADQIPPTLRRPNAEVMVLKNAQRILVREAGPKTRAWFADRKHGSSLP